MELLKLIKIVQNLKEFLMKCLVFILPVKFNNRSNDYCFLLGLRLPACNYFRVMFIECFEKRASYMLSRVNQSIFVTSRLLG